MSRTGRVPRSLARARSEVDRESGASTGQDVETMPIGGALRALAVVGPPITIATALLFYFGWALTAEQSRAMGVDESVFAMSTRDYVLRSLSALFVPLIVGSSLVLLWVVVHGWLLDLLSQSRHRDGVRLGARVLAWTAWALTPGLGLLLSLVVPGWQPLVVPLSLAVGFLLTEYGLRLRALADEAAGRPAPARPRWVPQLRGVLIGVLVTAALFWEVANFAEVVGRGKAHRVLESSNDYPFVVVYSKDDLQLAAPGVSAEVLPGEGSDFRFRYGGLHLLQRTGGRYFLVPHDWSPTESQLIVLRDDSSVRIELTGASAGDD